MTARALYAALLEGRLDAAERAEFAARLRDDADFAADLAAEDADEVLLVTRLLWQAAGGHDSGAPRFDPEVATRAAHEGLARQRSTRSAGWAVGLLALAAAAAVVLFLRPAGAPQGDLAPALQARGASGDVGVAVDWQAAGVPVLSGDTLAAGASVKAEWTNPDGRYTHLTLGAIDGEGRWHPLADAQPIGAVGVDDPVAPAGPYPLRLPAGAVQLCGVFSKGASPAATASGVRVCTDDLQLER